MNKPVPLEYVTSFAQTNQALMQHLATALLTGGDKGADFHSYAEVARAQQDYLQRMSTLWFGKMMDAVPAPIQPAKGDRRFASEEWRKSSLHDFLKDSYLINTRYVNDLIERHGGARMLHHRARRTLSEDQGPRLFSHFGLLDEDFCSLLRSRRSVRNRHAVPVRDQLESLLGHRRECHWPTHGL
jgi:hypothetical protein